MPEGQVDELVIETTSGEAALDLAPVVFDLYQRVFSLPPFNAGETAIADQQSYFPKLTGRPRFRLTLARIAETYVGFGYGYLLPPGAPWWVGLEEPLDQEFTQETGSRTFVIIDYGVLPEWRGRGVGCAVHDELLSGSGAVRASLAVRPTATETQAIYRRWGWRTVGHEIMDPPVPSPSFDILVLDEVPVVRR